MPLGFQRLNERSQRPNECINFIKPLTSSSSEDQSIAKDFLERIAAQCYPVMKKDYISVMSLEEHEPNSEFLGRNFNAGEVIQLVLKDKTGRWLSFRFVQMVMMHELAHCKQMNHSRAFWKVRNQYAEHMKELWSKKYQGEGVWGRGHDLTSGRFVHDRMPDNPDVPEHLCGGAYRRSRKRKRGKHGDTKSDLSTYAERQQKRIAKKFGVHGEGQDLGEDELVRGALESKRRQGKPRVAQSKRGRDLRANAALARFEAEKQQKEREEQQKNRTKAVDSLDCETDSESDVGPNDVDDGPNILETAEKITDQRGRDLVQVCGDEGEQNEGGEDELSELRRLGVKMFGRMAGSSEEVSSFLNGKQPVQQLGDDSETESEPDLNIASNASITKTVMKTSETSQEKFETAAEPQATNPVPAEHNIAKKGLKISKPSTPVSMAPVVKAQPAASGPAFIRSNDSDSSTNTSTCAQCTMENPSEAATCVMCSHVLKPRLVPSNWRCKSDGCHGSTYINAGDVGRCGLCSALKPVTAEAKPMGVIGASVLRWD